MFDNTKPHVDKINNVNTIRIGNNVPDGAVNLGYFNNNVNSNSIGASITDAPIDTINHMTVEKTILKQCINKDENIFPTSIFYSDKDNYCGNIPLEKIDWYPHEHTLNEEYSVTKIYEQDEKVLKVKEIPFEITNKDNVKLSGKLSAVDVEFIPIGYKEVVKKRVIETERLFRTYRNDTVTSHDYEFEDTIRYDNRGFVGTLKKVPDSTRHIPKNYPNAKAKWVSTTQLNCGDSFNYNGIILPRLSFERVEQQIDSYGWCRYWSGDMDGQYYDGSGIRFTDPYPRIPSESSYFLPNQIKSPQKPPYISSWTPNPSLAKPFGGNGSSNWVWATNVDFNRLTSYLGRDRDNLAKIVGCSNIEPDYIYGQPVYYTPLEIVNNPGIIGPSNHQGMQYLYSHIFREIPGHSCCQIERGLAPYVLERGSITNTDNIFFRDCIGFYTLRTTVEKGYYGKLIVTTNNVNYRHECDYEGIVEKTDTSKAKVPTKWKVIVRYIGQLTGGYIDYDAIATYKGVVNKKNILTTLDNYSSNVFELYTNDNHIIIDDAGDEKIFEGELFEITNVYKDNIPLFYKTTLKNKVYITDNKDSINIYTGDEIKLVNRVNKPINNKMKYQIVLSKTNRDNIYNVDIYTNFKTSINTDVYCLYNAFIDENIIPNTKEKIYVFPSMVKDIDYELEDLSKLERKKKIKIINDIIYKDNRKKVKIEYVVKAYKDNELIKTSQPFIVDCINKEYALNSEKYNFINNNNIISYINNTEASAKDLINLRSEGLSNTITTCDNSNITYSGSWSKDNTDYYTSNIPGDKIALSFTGCGVEFYFIKDNNSGSAIITIDSQEYKVSLYSDEMKKDCVLRIFGLEDKLHNVIITVNNFTHVNSLDYNVNFSNLTYYKEYDFDSDDIIYTAELTNNNINIPISNYVNLFTSPTGESNVSCEVFIPTGILNKTLYNGKLLLNTPYKEKDGKIYRQYSVKLVDYRSLVLEKQRNNGLLDNWYLLVKLATISKIFSYRGIKTKYLYSLPEYNTQKFDDKYGMPYVTIKKEKAVVLSDNIIKIKNTPMHILFNDKNITNVKVYLANGDIYKELSINNIVYHEGIIMLNSNISVNDNILVDYTYIENYYTYRGSYCNDTFTGLDINTNIYHRYKDNNIMLEGPSLLNKIIYVFSKPTVTIFDYGDLNIINDSIQKTSFLTSTNPNSFPEELYISENGYEGYIPKSGGAFIIRGSESSKLFKNFTEYQTYKTLKEIKDQYKTTIDGYTGLMYKVNNPTENKKIGTVYKDVSKVITVPNNTHDNTINYNDEEGYSGSINYVKTKEHLEKYYEDELVKENVASGSLTSYKMEGSGKEIYDFDDVYKFCDFKNPMEFNKDATMLDRGVIQDKPIHDMSECLYNTNEWTLSQTKTLNCNNKECKSIYTNKANAVLGTTLVIFGGFCVDLKVGPSYGSVLIQCTCYHELIHPFTIKVNCNNDKEEIKRFNFPLQANTHVYIRIQVINPNIEVVCIQNIDEQNKGHICLSNINDNIYNLDDFTSYSTITSNQNINKFSKIFGLENTNWEIINNAFNTGRIMLKNKYNYSFMQMYVCTLSVKIKGYVDCTKPFKAVISFYNAEFRYNERNIVVTHDKLNNGTTVEPFDLINECYDIHFRGYIVIDIIQGNYYIDKLILDDNYNRTTLQEYSGFYGSNYDTRYVNLETFKGNGWTYRTSDNSVAGRYGAKPIEFNMIGNYLCIKTNPDCDVECKITVTDINTNEIILCDIFSRDDTCKDTMIRKYINYKGDYTPRKYHVKIEIVSNNNEYIVITSITCGCNSCLYPRYDKVNKVNKTFFRIDDYNITLHGKWLTGKTSKGDFCMYPDTCNEKTYIEVEICSDYANFYIWCKGDTCSYETYYNGEYLETRNLRKEYTEYFEEHHYKLAYNTKNDYKNFNIKIMPLSKGFAIIGVKTYLNSKINSINNSGDETYCLFGLQCAIIPKYNSIDDINRILIDKIDKGYEYNGVELNETKLYNEKSDEGKRQIVKYADYDTSYVFSKTVKVEKERVNGYDLTYEGTVSKETMVIESYTQMYQGELSKDTDDTRVWQQSYDGIINRNKTPSNAISVLFILDYNINIRKIYSYICEDIDKIITSLKKSGLVTVNIGLVYCGDNNINKCEFDGSKFTTNVSKVLNTIKNINVDFYTNSNVLDAINNCIDTYTFPTNKKCIICLSNNVQKSSVDYITVQNKLIAKSITPYFITDLNDSNNKVFTQISNNCSGASFSIDNYTNEMISYLCGICNLNKVVIVNKNTLYHKFEEIPDDDNDMLVGSVYIKHYTSLLSTTLTDTRTPGGGIKDISDNIRKELQLESNSYYDIGYYDGEAYQENGVFVVRIDRNVLVEYGGHLTKDDVQSAVTKWSALGTVPIIEYVVPNEFVKESNIDVKCCDKTSITAEVIDI